MRFIIFFVFLGGWIFMWWWTYVFHIKACGVWPGFLNGETVLISDEAPYPLGFQWGDAVPVVSDRFRSWQDSLVGSMREDELLNITGIAYRDEVMGIDPIILARARTTAIAAMFADELPRRRIRSDARIGELRADLKDRLFPAFQADVLTRNEYVRETGRGIFIYYPFDSASVTHVGEITRILDEFAQGLRRSGRQIVISPYLDAQATDTIPAGLLEWRLRSIRDSLVARGVDTMQVSIDASFLPVSDQSVKLSDQPGWIRLSEFK